jgi:D-inositol-3-phosphate glycosyltransferase
VFIEYLSVKTGYCGSVNETLDQNLHAALTKTVSPNRAGRQFQVVERLVAEALGGEASDLHNVVRGPDAVVYRAGSTPLAVEIKTLRAATLNRNFSNHASNLLAAAIETRRAYRDKVTLGAIIFVSGPPTQDSGSEYRGFISASLQRLLRANDGVGYDAVLVGWVTDGLQWDYITPDKAPGHHATHIVNLTSVEAFARLKSEQILARSNETDLALDPAGSERLRILLVADEWKSGRGGISTVNRELAAALASTGVDAAVFVPYTSDEDIRSASDLNVKLVTPARVVGLSERELLLLRPVFADHNWEPDVVVGHGRILGPYAAAQQQQFFPRARRVHFVHTDAEQLEAAKESLGGGSNMSSADTRRVLERNLASSADLVVGVGPLLTETIQDELISHVPKRTTVCLIPGLRQTFDVSKFGPPSKNQVLILGRADDFQSKGIDIAAEALLKIVDRWPSTKSHPPTLVIRGVPDHAAALVKEKLDAIFEGRVSYFLRPYSDSESQVNYDLAQARVILMPSRHEGFGLAAYEALAGGVPVLIAAESGLAQFLREESIDTRPRSCRRATPRRNSQSTDGQTPSKPFSTIRSTLARKRANFDKPSRRSSAGSNLRSNFSRPCPAFRTYQHSAP